MAFEGAAACFDGPEDYHHRIEESPTKITEKTILIMRGAGPLGGESMNTCWCAVC